MGPIYLGPIFHWENTFHRMVKGSHLPRAGGNRLENQRA
jgi:hypothetical protein